MPKSFANKPILVTDGQHKRIFKFVSDENVKITQAISLLISLFEIAKKRSWHYVDLLVFLKKLEEGDE